MKTKKCTKCGETKPVIEFHSDRSRKDKLNPHCKRCVYEYHEGRREYNRATARARYRANREATLERSQASYDLHQSVTARRATRHGKPWTEEEVAFLRSDHGLTSYQVAIKLGRTYAAVHSRIYRPET
ncbi:gp29 [Corynebacterium phage BFK20]|uniref:Gp29 n=1 Tax=Corynebacterium phage BFK20 TaxID=28358 RepID=Q3V5G6_9CAUD|nr:endonuclease [Corynebacterium phage BFK20]CAJ29712.1 gp29 [Corynebacterium phage BFK20]